MSALEVQPTIEDVFQADQTTSVEEYLRQIEESSIMNAIQVSTLPRSTLRSS